MNGSWRWIVWWLAGDRTQMGATACCVGDTNRCRASIVPEVLWSGTSSAGRFTAASVMPDQFKLLGRSWR